MKLNLLQKIGCVHAVLMLFCCMSLHAVTISNNATTPAWNGNTITATGTDNININEIAAKLAAGNVTIEVTGDLDMSAFTAINTGTAYTLLIKATGNISAQDIDLHGTDGSGNTTADCEGRSAHNLQLEAGGTVTAGTINAIGGDGGGPVQNASQGQGDGGNGGNGGNITIKGAEGVTIAGIETIGGTGGASNDDGGYKIPGGGGNGGSITLESANGSITTSGAIDVSGGESNQIPVNLSARAPGNPGTITITANTDVVMGSTITANGGNAGPVASGDGDNPKHGADGGVISIISQDGSVTVDGSITANGGIGAKGGHGKPGGNGGDGGKVTIVSKDDLSVNASITVNGNVPGATDDSNAAQKSGNGGNGGEIMLETTEGDVFITAPLTANGSDGANSSVGSNVGKGGTGGDGGTITVKAPGKAPGGNLTVTSTITAEGGKGGDAIKNGIPNQQNNSGNGGQGGTIDLCGIDGNADYDENDMHYSYGTKGQQGSPNYGSGTEGVNGTDGTLCKPTGCNRLLDLLPVDALCEGDALTLELLVEDVNAVPLGAWEIEDAPGSDSYVALTLPYDVLAADNGKAVRYNINGCGPNQPVILTVNQPVSDIQLKEIDDKAQVAPGENVTVEVTPNNLNYAWWLNDTEVTAPAWPMEIFEDLKVVVIADDGVCPKVESDPLFIKALWPNAITFEQGVNSHFLKGTSMKMTVFNRHGVTIFDGTGGWNGKFKNKTVEPGTYYYVLTLPNGDVRKATIEVVKEK